MLRMLSPKNAHDARIKSDNKTIARIQSAEWRRLAAGGLEPQATTRAQRLVYVLIYCIITTLLEPADLSAYLSVALLPLPMTVFLPVTVPPLYEMSFT